MFRLLVKIFLCLVVFHYCMMVCGKWIRGPRILLVLGIMVKL
jgi:hypothetical protein